MGTPICRRLHRIVSIFTIICFIITSLPLQIEAGETSGVFKDHLVPEYVNSNQPLKSPERKEKFLIGSVLLGLVKADATITSKKINYFADRDGLTISLFFEGSFSVPVDIDGESTLVFFVPCFLTDESGKRGKLYYSGLVIKDTETEIAVFSEDEFKSEVGDIKKQLSLPEDLIENFTVEAEAELQDKDSFYALHISDDAVELSTRFLDNLRCSALRKRIESLAKRDKLKAVKDPAYSPNAIIINSEKTQVKQRAKAIISQLLVVEGFNAAIVTDAMKAFDLFWENSEEFDIDKVDPEVIDPRIKDVFISVNHRLNNEVGNESGIRFTKEAYQNYIDVSDIDLDKDCKEVIDDIGSIYKHILTDQIQEHNKKIGVVPVGLKDISFNIEFMGMKPEDGFVLADGSIGTVKVKMDPDRRGKVTLVLNENFVKVMYLLLKKGLKGRKGDIHDIVILPTFMGDSNRYKNPYMGNIYKSIIYSALLHERGHIYINDIGRVMLQEDEKLARGRRGRKFLYVNLLATMYFWISIIEGMGDYEASSRLRNFMEEYPEIFEGLTNEEKKKMMDHLEEITLDFGIRRDAWLNDLPKKEHPKTDSVLIKIEDDSGGENKKLSPRDIYNEILKSNDFIFRKDLENSFGKIDKTKFDWSLSVLVEELGLVERKIEKGLVKYKALPLDPEKIEAIDELLLRNEVINDGIIDLNLKGRIRELIDIKWPIFLADVLREGPKARFGKKIPVKKLVYIDTEWLPEEQKPFMLKLIQQMDYLEKFGITVVRGQGHDGADRLREKMKEKDIPAKDVVVIGGNNIRRYENLKPILAQREIDIDKAFFFGIDSRYISKNSYVRFMEIFTMAMQIALNDAIILRIEDFQALHPNIYITVENRRTLVFMPSMEPLNLEDIKQIYQAQLDALVSA